MGNLLDFSGRLGRLAFLGWSLGLGVFVFGAGLATMLLAAMSGVLGVLGCIALVVVAFLASVSLQVRRIRDIGWPPLPIVGGWFGFMLLDALVAHLVPALRMHGGANTMLGAVVNLALALVLLLWPGDGSDDGEWTPPVPHPAPDQRYVPTTRQRTLPGEPSLAPAAPGPRGFGRRTV